MTNPRNKALDDKERPKLRGPFDAPPINRMSREQEERVAEELGGRRRPASGSRPGQKGDVAVAESDLLIECKATKHGGIAVHGTWLRKITMQARGEGKQPAIVLTLEGVGPEVEHDWMLLPLSVARALLKGKA